MINNTTNATLPLRISESVDVLTQQILGHISREGAGPFVMTSPEVPAKPSKKIRDKPHFDQRPKDREKRKK